MNSSNTPYGQPYGNANYGYTSAPMGAPQLDDEEESGFDVMEWVRRIIHYWWLFLIAGVIAFSLAWLKNRKWIPSYYSQGTVIIKENMGYGANSALMQGFGVDAGYKNVNNQVIMLGSYDLMCRVVDSLPFLSTEYITQGRFKTRNLYHNTPIFVETTRLEPAAYSAFFTVEFLPEAILRLSFELDKKDYSYDLRYGEAFETPVFAGVIWPNQQIPTSGKVHFRFRSHESLVDEFMGRLQLNFVTQGSSVLALSLVSETPERDCEFIDKLAQIYLLQNLEQKNEVAENSIRFIDQQLASLSSSLSVSEGAMTNFRQENKFVDVSSYAGQLMGRISGYDQERLALRLKETYFDYLTQYVDSRIESGAVIAPSSLGLNEPMLSGLVQQLNDLRIQRGELSEKNVYYAKYTKDIDHVKEAIAEVVASMRASLNIEKEDLDRRVHEVEREMQKLPQKELEMVSIERNYRIDDNYYTFFLQKRAEAEIQKASNLPDNTILDKARTTTVMNGGAKKKTTTTYLAIGLLIPLLLLILSEFLNNKVRTPKEAAKLSHFRLIGTLRHARSQNPTLVKSHPRSTYAEMLRSIRTRMEFIIQRKDKAVVCITSTESGDGKTFLSTNLAALYGMTGRRTILIDLDIRKPNVHTKLGLEGGQGITNFLIGECSADDILVKDTPFGFDFMRAGTIPPNPGELIHSAKLAQLIADLREKYDYIVLDTSPIGLVPDAYAVVEASDICLFVVRCLETDKSFAQQTLAQLEEVNTESEKIQILLSDIPSSGFHYGYRYGQGYGYGYGSGSGYGYGYGNNKYGHSRYGKYLSRYGYGRNSGADSNYYTDEE